jgi:phenylpropionate dioxygenase-like ring-hydroxylating dioxygenase large terminal subunit
MVGWRARSGRINVMDAYCEHLGAHLGFGGHVEGEVIECAFHGWQWNAEGRNVCIPYESRPNRGRRIRTYPVIERDESIYIWHDAEGREPFFEPPDVFASFGDGSSLADYWPRGTLFEQNLELHPQYVLENGVDFAHFKFVHKTPIVPIFTRHDFDEPVSYVDFTITFEGDENQSIDDVKSGVEAINGGLGSRSRRAPAWSTTAPSPRSLPSTNTPPMCQDVYIWSHQRYSDQPALSGSEFKGFTAIREWAKKFFYPDGRGGSAAELHATASASAPQ